MSKKFAKSLGSGRVRWLGYMGCRAGTLPHWLPVLSPSGPAQGRSTPTLRSGLFRAHQAKLLRQKVGRILCRLPLLGRGYRGFPRTHLLGSSTLLEVRSKRQSFPQRYGQGFVWGYKHLGRSKEPFRSFRFRKNYRTNSSPPSRPAAPVCLAPPTSILSSLSRIPARCSISAS
jgi:hypothetical protein